MSFVSQACRRRRLNEAVSRNNRIKRVAQCRFFDRHVQGPYEISMALGTRLYVQLLLRSACTSMYRHVYDWNIVECDVKHQFNSTQQLTEFQGYIVILRGFHLIVSTFLDWISQVTNCNFVGLLHHPFWLKLLSVLFGIIFQLFQLLSLAKDHWRGFNIRNAHMVHIVNLIRFKMVYTS